MWIRVLEVSSEPLYLLWSCRGVSNHGVAFWGWCINTLVSSYLVWDELILKYRLNQIPWWIKFQLPQMAGGGHKITWHCRSQPCFGQEPIRRLKSACLLELVLLWHFITSGSLLEDERWLWDELFQLKSPRTTLRHLCLTTEDPRVLEELQLNVEISWAGPEKRIVWMTNGSVKNYICPFLKSVGVGLVCMAQMSQHTCLTTYSLLAAFPYP